MREPEGFRDAAAARYPALVRFGTLLRIPAAELHAPTEQRSVGRT